MPNLLKKIFSTPIIKDYNDDLGTNFKKPRKSLLIIALRAFMFLIFIAASLIIISNWLDDDYYYDDYGDYSTNGCNVMGISVVGDIVTFKSGEDTGEVSSDEIIINLDNHEKEGFETKAILVEIDSNGGYPVAAEEIAAALKRTNKPIVAVIRESGNSAAYWVASAADIIFASKSSDLGSIGMTGSYLDYSEKNTKEGIKYIELSSGKFKDTGDPDKALNQEERELLLRDTKILHENFIAAVAENRGIDVEKVRQLADGSTMLGQMALENGLIDRIGLYYDAVDYLEELIGEEVEICWY